MTTTRTRMTAEEYFATSTEGDRMQLIDGAMVLNEPKLRHQAAQAQLLRALMNWVDAGEARGLASLPIDIVVSDHDVYGPDLVWYVDASTPDPDRAGNPVPDLAVEIRSEGTWRYDVGVKKSRYEENGLPELWLVDTASCTVLVYRRSAAGAPYDVELELASGYSLTSPQLPGFELPVERIFPYAA